MLSKNSTAYLNHMTKGGMEVKGINRNEPEREREEIYIFLGTYVCPGLQSIFKQSPLTENDGSRKEEFQEHVTILFEDKSVGLSEVTRGDW